MLRTLLPLALVSGSAALVYEAIWLRWFRLLFGNTAYAASATLAAFFAGMALGSWWFGRRAATTDRPLAVYAAIEAGTAVTALLVPWLVAAYDPIYAWLYEGLVARPTAFVAIKFALALVAVLPTATLLGGTLPMLATALARHDAARARGTAAPDPSGAGRGASALYAVNTLGAAIGSAAGSLWLPDALGVRASYGVAMALSLAVAGAALALSRSPALRPGAPGKSEARSAADGREARSQRAQPAGARERGFLGLAFLSGFGVLGFEVLLIQAVALALESSVYSFGAVLIVVLATLAASSALVAALPERATGRRLLIGSLAIQALLLALLPAAIVAGTRGLASHSAATFGNGLWLAVAFGGLPLLNGGLVLPATFRLARGRAIGARVGGLLAANTVGGIVGSLAASFVLLDGLGLWQSMAALAVLYALAAVGLLPTGRARAAAAGAALVVAATVLSSAADPRGLPLAWITRKQRLVALDEGAHGVVAVVDVVNKRLERDRWLRIDGRYTLSGALARVHQERLGHLPLVLSGRPRRALYVGTATGETASASVLHPLEQRTLVELVPEVQALAAVHFAEQNRGVYDHERTRVVVEDGRNHVRATRETYDAIAFDLFVPQRPGVGGMYTRDSFAAAAERLEDGGVLCVWLPLYQLDDALFQILAATFVDVFPDAMLWRGDFFTQLPTAALVGVRGGNPSAEAISAAGRALADLGVEDRWLRDPRGLWMLYVGALADAIDPTVPRVINTDDRPRFEYVAARSTSRGRAIFRLRSWPAIAERLLDGRQPGQPQRPAGSAEASRAMARAQQLTAGQERPRWNEAADLLRRHVPRALLEVPDRNIAETWPTAAVPAAPR